MKIAYFDCFSGISGDMILGALLDAGLPLADLNREIAKLGVKNVAIEREATARHAIAATRAKVCVAGAPLGDAEHHLDLSGEPTHDHAHAHLKDITSRIDDSRLDDVVKERSIRVFERLCAAEAEVHNAAPAEVALHEVGALDARAVAGLQLLEVEEVCASPLRFGTGFVRCAHGRYPVPVPGVLALCRDVPTEQTDIRAELVTPTGAAIITTLARSFGPQPPFCQQAVGYGAGRRDLEDIPNLLRLRLGERVPASERVLLIEANIDDMNPEVYGYLFDRLLAQGACDVYATPVLMKKGRPGNVLSVLAPVGRLDELAAIVLQETTTIGLRYYGVERRVLKRQVRAVATPYGEVNVKFSYLDGRRRAAPEYEDCARLAQQHQVPLLSVYEAARAAAIKE
ncbi:MAG: nickel pincer cofactor biosynthesis protein LarC [Candidatus Latescibacteria bacterium]|nr:nickel pincer cofactor biosynthesis protein LarC [Candidatus Latescibacterota bacterium]